MSENNDSAVWYISNPSAWPKPPHWMSFSKLLELEACPRRWALSGADYPQIWEKHGYPRIPQITALEGTVVHLALEKITQALVKNECHSLIEERAFTTLKELGGYTVIINDSIESALRQYQGNPRAKRVLGYIRQCLMPRVPMIRIRVQQLLSRIHLSVGDKIASKSAVGSIETTCKRLSNGSYAEVELKVPELCWHGIVDFLSHNSHFCEIRDFKTGIYKPEHEVQLRVYALLWARDHDLNPFGRLANKLFLSYEEHDIEVSALSEDKLRALEIEIQERTTTVLNELRLEPPEARPNHENCVYCNVRHLCDEYWLWQNQQEDIRCESLKVFFADLQIHLLSQHGPTSWDGIVECSPAFPAIKVYKPILLRTVNLPFDLHPSQRIRLINDLVK